MCLAMMSEVIRAHKYDVTGNVGRRSLGYQGVWSSETLSNMQRYSTIKFQPRNSRLVKREAALDVPPNLLLGLLTARNAEQQERE